MDELEIGVAKVVHLVVWSGPGGLETGEYFKD